MDNSLVNVNVFGFEKKEEIEDLKETLEIHSEAVEMVEKLTEQKQELEEKIMEMKMDNRKQSEIKRVNDELIANYEDTCKEMQDEITKLEYQIYELRRII